MGKFKNGAPNITVYEYLKLRQDGKWRPENRVQFGASYMRSGGLTEVLLKTTVFWHVTSLSNGKSSS